MPLTTYDEVRPWARAIKDQVLSRRMPKWSAARGYGAFANDPSLTPNEMAIVAAWVNGGQPQGLATAAASTAPPATVKPQTAAVIVPASAADVSVEVAAGWVSGWLFQPGDPLVTTATVTSGDGAPLGTWVAGDGPVQLPAGSGLRLISPIRVQLKRRTAADYEKAVTPAASRLHLTTRATTPVRRVWLERLACGEPRTRAAAQLLAVRPLLADHSSARVWLERAGAPHVIIGWFRDAEALYPRTYWLARPIGLTPESRIAADASCEMELTLASR